MESPGTMPRRGGEEPIVKLFKRSVDVACRRSWGRLGIPLTFEVFPTLFSAAGHFLPVASAPQSERVRRLGEKLGVKNTLPTALSVPWCDGPGETV